MSCDKCKMCDTILVLHDRIKKLESTMEAEKRELQMQIAKRLPQ